MSALGLTEGTNLAFRMRTVSGTLRSAYSNTATYHVPLKLPTFGSVTNDVNGISVHWFNNSAVADTLVFERGVAANISQSHVWTVLPEVAFGATSLLDSGLPEHVYVQYRVTYAKGTERASAVSTYVHTSLGSPSALKAVPQVEGVALSWQNHSPSASEVVVVRASGFEPAPVFAEVAHLPPSATSYQDLGLASGYYTYRVEARQANQMAAGSLSARVATLPQPSALSLTPAVLTLPLATMAVRDAKGAWYLADNLTYNASAILSPSGAGWVTYALPGQVNLGDPGLQLDAEGRPHTVFLRAVQQGSSLQAIVHAWYDGTAWQSEEVARRSLSSFALGAGATFQLDAAGKPHLLWQVDQSSGLGLEYARKGLDGAWVIEALPGGGSTLATFHLTLDGSGSPLVLLGANTAVWLLERQGAGQWVKAMVPTGEVHAGWYSLMDPVPTPQGDLRVFFTRQQLSLTLGWNTDLCEIRRVNGLWASVQVLATTANNDTYQSGHSVRSSSSDRVALQMTCGDSNVVFTCTKGVWTSTVLGPNSPGRPFLGFDAKDQFYSLQCIGYPHGTTQWSYVLYSELP